MPSPLMTVMRAAVSQAFSVIGGAALFFATHPFLLLLSLLPASLRAYQMKYGSAPQALEIVVEGARVFFAVWAVYAANGNAGPLFSSETWSRIWHTVLPRTAAMQPEDWIQASAAYFVAMAALWLAGCALEKLVFPGAMPIVYFIKNMTVIPLAILILLRLIRWI